MKKIIAALVVFLTLSLTITKAQTGPVMVFEKTEIDYGTIAQDADGVRYFKFKNTGSEPLIIKNAVGSCGCTVPEWPQDPIYPGQTGLLKVKYETSRLGTYTKKITVTTNETNSTHELSIKVNVVEAKFLTNTQSGGK